MKVGEQNCSLAKKNLRKLEETEFSKKFQSTGNKPKKVKVRQKSKKAVFFIKNIWVYKFFQNFFALFIHEQGSFAHAIMSLAISFVGLLALQKFCFDAKSTLSCPIFQFFYLKCFYSRKQMQRYFNGGRSSFS